ncbi:hypothetical protein Dimus_029140, partial [Dionaea muscipula]
GVLEEQRRWAGRRQVGDGSRLVVVFAVVIAQGAAVGPSSSAREVKEDVGSGLDSCRHRQTVVE